MKRCTSGSVRAANEMVPSMSVLPPPPPQATSVSIGNASADMSADEWRGVIKSSLESRPVAPAVPPREPPGETRKQGNAFTGDVTAGSRTPHHTTCGPDALSRRSGRKHAGHLVPAFAEKCD